MSMTVMTKREWTVLLHLDSQTEMKFQLFTEDRPERSGFEAAYDAADKLAGMFGAGANYEVEVED